MLRSPNPILPALLLSAMLGLAAPVQGQAQRPMTIVDMIEVPSLSDPQISPDGEQVLYVRSDADWELNRTVGHIWRIAVDEGDPLQLTAGREGQSSPRWSPDGTWIAFLAEREDEADGEGEENETVRQIHLLNTAGGEALPLTDHPTSIASIQWSPDGVHIYYLATDEKTAEQKRRDEAEDDVFAFDEDWRHRHLWRVRVDGGDRERITDGDFTIRSYALSRDGARVALHRAPNPLLDDSDDAEVWVMDPTGANAVRITDNAVTENGARLSPDNHRVLWVSGSDGDRDPYYNDRVFVAPAAGGPATVWMPDLSYEVTGAEWSADGSAIYFTANTGVRVELFRVDGASGTPEQLTRGDHRVADWTFHPGVGRHAFGLNHAGDPGEVHVLDADGGTPMQVTNAFDYLDEFALPTQEAITWTGDDGVDVEGLLYLPADYRPGERYGLVVQTHGGPASSDRFGFPRSSRFVPILAELGYVVLKPNYRGSTGYTPGRDGRRGRADRAGHRGRRPDGQDGLVGRGSHDQQDHHPHRPVQSGSLGGGRRQLGIHVRPERRPDLPDAMVRR